MDAYGLINTKGHEIMLLPIHDVNNVQSGALLIFYKSEAIKKELSGQKLLSNFITTMCIAITIFVLALYFILLRTKNKGNADDGNEEDNIAKKRKQTYVYYSHILHNNWTSCAVF